MNTARRTALVIEDNEVNRYLADFLLKRAGCEVHHAHNGVEGVERAVALKPDLVVLDIEMPEMDGYEVAVRLRSDPATSGIPIFVVTSYAMAGDRARAMALGVSDYLEKPFDPTEFLRRVEALLPPTER